MGTFVSIILDILAILAIIVFGSFIVVVIADLILCLVNDHDGIIFRKHKKDETKVEKKEDVVDKEDIVVYTDKANPNGRESIDDKNKKEVVDGHVVTDVDFDKAVEEQQALNRKRNQAPMAEPQPVVAPKPKPVPAPQVEDNGFWNIDEDKDFTNLLDDVVEEAKAQIKKEKEPKVVEVKDEKKEEVNKQDEETQKALEELKLLKEQQQKEIEELRILKEDFAREKEEQLAMYKEHLDKAKAEELEKLKQEAIKEQERLEAERAKIEEEQIKEIVVESNEPIVKETIIKDEEEINKLKLKNLMRMNNRLTRIIRDTERLQIQKAKEQEKLSLERQRLLEKEQELKKQEQLRRIEIQRQNHERLVKQSEAIKKRNEINRKLLEVSNRVGKYKLNTKTVKVQEEPVENHVIEETITTVEHTLPDSDRVLKTVEKTPMKSSAKPIFEKEYYEAKLQELDAELREAEKELRLNKSEYIPLTRIHKAYARDSEKLRKREMVVAKQKVALYGVNSTKVDPAKKAKLDENLASLTELKDSVAHCEEVIKKNKDRYPILEKNNKLLVKQIDRINEDIKVCEKAISYYNKLK